MDRKEAKNVWIYSVNTFAAAIKLLKTAMITPIRTMTAEVIMVEPISGLTVMESLIKMHDKGLTRVAPYSPMAIRLYDLQEAFQ